MMTNPLPQTVPQWVTAIMFTLVVFFLGTFVRSVWGMDGRLHDVETWSAVQDQRYEHILQEVRSIKDMMKGRKP